jgi:hypothetical protein
MTTMSCIMIVIAASLCLVSSMEIGDTQVGVRPESVFLMKMLQEYYNPPQRTDPPSNLCLYRGYTLYCDFLWRLLETIASVSIKMTFDPSSLKVAIGLQIEGHDVIEASVPALASPPVCGDTPFLAESSSVCFILITISVQGGKLNACYELAVQVSGKFVENAGTMCFELPQGRKLSDQNIYSDQ